MREGWEMKKLGDVIEIKNGKNQQAVISENGKYKILGSAGNVMGFANDYICEAGTTIIGRKGNISKPIYIEEKFWNVDTAFGFFPKNEKEFDKRFLHYLCLGIDFKSMNRGTTIPSLVKSELQAIPIPVPPLPEQQRIVAYLDQTFAKLNQAKANTLQNLQNAKELFETELRNVFENKGEGWEEKTLGEVGKVCMCKRILKEQTLPVGDIPFYKIGTFGKTANAFITKEVYQEYVEKYSFPKKGDILISASGTIGRCVIYDGKPAYFQDSNIVWIDNKENQISNSYLFLFYEHCNWNPSKGATISRLYNDDLRRIIIHFPKSLQAQQEIVSKLDNLKTQTQQLESVYQTKLNNIEELYSGILKRAFENKV